MFDDESDDTFWRSVVSRAVAGESPGGAEFILLARARARFREFSEMSPRDSENADIAFTLNYRPEKMVADAVRGIGELKATMGEAERNGKPEKIAASLRETATAFERTLASTRVTLEQAVQTVETAKALIKREEARIRQETADKINRFR